MAVSSGQLSNGHLLQQKISKNGMETYGNAYELVHFGRFRELQQVSVGPEVLTPASCRNWLKGSESFCGPPGMGFSLGRYRAKVMAAPRSSLTKDGGGPLQIASAIGTSDFDDAMMDPARWAGDP